MKLPRLFILVVPIICTVLLFYPVRVMALGEVFPRADDFELAKTIVYETARGVNWKESHDPQVPEFEEVMMNGAEFTILRSSFEGMVFVSVFETGSAALGFQEEILAQRPVLWDDHVNGGDTGGYNTPAWLKNPREIDFQGRTAVRAGGEAANGRVFYGWASKNFFLGCYDYTDPPACAGVLNNVAARHGLGFEETPAPLPTSQITPSNRPQPTSQPGSTMVPDDLKEIIQLITGMVTNPAVPAAGAAAGALTAWLISSLRGGSQPPKPPMAAGKRPRPGDRDASGRVYSPVPGGGWISPKMYAYQKGLLDKGWRWDPGRGKFTVQDGSVDENGRVYLAGDPNGEGSRWMSPQDYVNHKKLLANGMVYDRNYGYQTREDLNRLKAGDERWRQQSRLDDQARNRQIKAEMDAMRKQQAEQRARELRVEQLKEQQSVNEIRMEKANQAATGDYTPQVVLGTAENISREIVTGFDPEGGLSLPSLALRGVAAGLSMGKSEIYFQTLNSLYTMKDAVDRGATGGEAVARSVAEVLVMEGAGRVLAKGMKVGQTAFSNAFPAAAKTITGATETIAKKMESMNKPLSEVFGKTTGAEAAISAETALSQVEKEMLDALRSGAGPTDLYSSGGRQILGRLEEKGLISPEQARQLTGRLTDQVDQAVADGADEAARRLRLQTGVQVQEVLVADSGSSGMAKSGLTTANRSVVTDADRSLMLKVDKDALAVYAHENQMTPEQAYNDLLKRYQNLMDDSVDQALKGQGFQNGAADVDYKSYAGIGSQSGPADSYPANYTAARTEMGATNIRSYNPDGSLARSSDTSGRAFLDEMGLEQQKHTGVLPADPAGKIDTGELKTIAGQQLNSAGSHADVKSVAKALDRGNYVAGRQHIITDPNLSQAAREIARNPQELNAILNKFGFSPEEFVKGARVQVELIHNGIRGGTP